jgi:uncharacterized membrane protein YhaH (DUF805 family)
MLKLMIQPLEKYAVFTGRACRTEYWLFALFSFMVGLVAAILDPTLALVAILGLALPSIAVGVRRLHDANMSGWFWLLCVLPYLGWVAFIIFGCLPPVNQENRFGDTPVVE